MTIFLKAATFWFVFLFLCITRSYASGIISYVYNIRIAESTKKSPSENLKIRSSTINIIPVTQFRKRQIIGTQNALGFLASYVFIKKNLYARLDWAAARVHEKMNTDSFSRTQTDDILLTLGYTTRLCKQVPITLSGLLGIPTHKDMSLNFVQFGYAHLGFGLQIDAAYTYLKRKSSKHSIRIAARAIYFQERKIILSDSIKPVNFTPGNLVDLFIAHNSNFDKNRFELGYDATFLFGSQLNPIISSVNAPYYIRSSFYANYKYVFMLGNYDNSIAGNISYGFDNLAKQNGFKRIITTWLGWSINF